MPFLTGVERQESKTLSVGQIPVLSSPPRTSPESMHAKLHKRNASPSDDFVFKGTGFHSQAALISKIRLQETLETPKSAQMDLNDRQSSSQGQNLKKTS